MNRPIIIPAIDNDGSLYPVEKLRAHSEALFHLAVSVFVFDGDDLLIQRRAQTKYHCGGLWANTCCSHPHWGEISADCARRRLTEELGFSVPLAAAGEVEYAADVGSGLHEHELVSLFVGEARRDQLQILANPAEVMDVRWVGPKELTDEIAAHPELFTPWFRIYVERFPDLKFV